MIDDTQLLDESSIKSKIYTIRGIQVMLDRDLAELYGVLTKNLNKAVKRNIERFPDDFMFQLSEEEFGNLRFQNGTSKSNISMVRFLPYAFTEQGVASLSGVLKSKKAAQVNINIMRDFVAMRRFIVSNAKIFYRLDNVENKLIEYDKKFHKIFQAIEDKSLKPKKGIFFDGQIFKAYKFVSDLIRAANNSIILIDNFIDDTVLTLLSKKRKDVEVIIYTKRISRQLKLDLEKYNLQYQSIKIQKFNASHDRFLIIDDKEVYHIGASLKDLGKKWFAFSRFDKDALKILSLLGD